MLSGRSSFHSISFPSEWGLEAGMKIAQLGQGFHSISFPSEWGRIYSPQQTKMSKLQVSIQLVSPASGDFNYLHRRSSLLRWQVSIQLVSPASGDFALSCRLLSILDVSIQLVSPASGDDDGTKIWVRGGTFPFN